MPGPDTSKLRYDYPIFEDQIEPKGLLTRDPRCHACWWYAMLAQKNKRLVGKGPEDQIIVYDVGSTPPVWMDKNYEKIARSVAIQYGLESPDDFLRYRAVVWAEGVRLGMDLTEVLGVQPGGNA
jgi:hypothetical protein